MKWTRTLPTEPGWYWYRGDGLMSSVEVVKLRNIRHLGLCFDSAGRHPIEIDEWPGWWSDQPIFPPEGEPK